MFGLNEMVRYCSGLRDTNNACVAATATAVHRYYWKPAESGADSSTWIVYQEGGGWCYDATSCTARCGTPQHPKASSALCSSKAWGTSIPLEGIFYPLEDSFLEDAHKVYIRYCTSDGEQAADAAPLCACNHPIPFALSVPLPSPPSTPTLLPRSFSSACTFIETYTYLYRRIGTYSPNFPPGPLSKSVACSHKNSPLRHVDYCVTVRAGHMGNAGASEATSGWHFRGAAVVEATFRELVKTHGLGGGRQAASASASTSTSTGSKDLVVYGGGSAGGRGAMVHLDYVQAMIGAQSVTQQYPPPL